MKRYEIIEGQEYEIRVAYHLGGPNYFNGKQEARGYYLHIQPVEREYRGDFQVVTCKPTNGAKTLIREVKRQSEKQYRLAIEEAERTTINWLFEKMGIKYKKDAI